MDDEQVKRELMLHAAKAMVSASVTSADNIFRTVSTVVTVTVPAYLALLTAIGQSTASVPLPIRFLPILLWLVSLLACVYRMLPRPVYYDLKNLPGILNIYSESARKTRFWSLFSTASLVLGLAIAAFVILHIGENMPVPNPAVSNHLQH